jgi:hypothetical protein
VREPGGARCSPLAGPPCRRSRPGRRAARPRPRGERERFGRGAAGFTWSARGGAVAGLALAVLEGPGGFCRKAPRAGARPWDEHLPRPRQRRKRANVRARLGSPAPETPGFGGAEGLGLARGRAPEPSSFPPGPCFPGEARGASVSACGRARLCPDPGPLPGAVALEGAARGLQPATPSGGGRLTFSVDLARQATCIH